MSARHALDAFLASLPDGRRFDPNDAACPVRSAAIPMGLDRAPAGPGILVVGDGAGLANPFTGEGIGYAMESAELAARMVAEALRGAHPDPEAAYAAAVRRRFRRIWRAGRRFAGLIVRPSVTGAAARYGLRIPVVSAAAVRYMIDA